MFGLTTTALLAFAANSILTRLALASDSIDPYSFTVIRLASGALVLWALTLPSVTTAKPARGNWRGAFLLIVYAVPFSLAYLRLDAGTGALLLFGAVQLTMIACGIASGTPPRPLEWLGFVGAGGGVVYLVFPGVTSPDPMGAAFMLVAGAGWGGYTLAGRGGKSPLRTTSRNFRRAALVATPPMLLVWPWLDVSMRGAALAVASGAVASGMGYVVWYGALARLSLTRAALVQLAVPVIAALGGVVFIAEAVTPRLVLSSTVILGSIALGIYGRRV